jgi:hypothetical protein
MAGLVVDTHALVWYLLGSPRLSVQRLTAAWLTLWQGLTGIAFLTCLTESSRPQRSTWDFLS